jgi:hypothetical protein
MSQGSDLELRYVNRRSIYFVTALSLLFMLFFFHYLTFLFCCFFFVSVNYISGEATGPQSLFYLIHSLSLLSSLSSPFDNGFFFFDLCLFLFQIYIFIRK